MSEATLNHPHSQQAKKKAFYAVLFGHFWCSVVTSVTYGSNLPTNQKNPQKISQKIPKNPNFKKSQKLKKIVEKPKRTPKKWIKKPKKNGKCHTILKNSKKC